jgi:DNA-binding PucR family transcriptional regulator
MLSGGERSYLGIGQCTKNMKCIAKSYNQAAGVLKLQKSINQDQKAITYSSLGLYKLLLVMDDKDIVKEYYTEVMGMILRYDETHDTDFCKVLECYLKHGGSVKDTAEELFVHRNTINKKINKIEEITGFDLSDLDTRVKFKIAFMIQEIL